MTVIDRRRMLMQMAVKDDWDYVLTEKYNNTARLRPIRIEIIAGQTITIAWSGCNSNSYAYRLWALKDGAEFSGVTPPNASNSFACGNIPSSLKPDGQLTYTVSVSGGLVVGGLNEPGSGGSINAYTFPGDWIKVRIR